MPIDPTTGIETGMGDGVGMGLSPQPPAMELEPEANLEVNIPPQEGLQGSGEKSGMKEILFEDYFPKLDLSDNEKEGIAAWFNKDLRSCVRALRKKRREWATYRAVYMMEYIEKFYPDMGIGANYSSGLITEKMLEGMDRLRRSIFKADPLFVADTKVSGANNDIDFIHRSQWALHTVFMKALKIKKTMGYRAMFEFLLDGSMIMEADTLFEKVPQRTIKTYNDIEDLALDEEKIIDKSRYELAIEDIQVNGIARVLIEEDVVTENGLQVFHVDKSDHLIPEGVYEDEDVKFRGRRMYLTESDLRLLKSDEVNWYDKKAVDEIIDARETKKNLTSVANSDSDQAAGAMEQLKAYDVNSELCYQHQDEDDRLEAVPNAQPYDNIFAIYRVTCKYGYKTKSDPKGVIPKWCVFDYSPEGGKILRAVTYPHFTEHKNWFHFKYGYAPKSYYGFGYGARLIQDDYLESNAVDLFLDSAALSTFNPMIAKHPDAGGMFPFYNGYGPGKIGYAMDVNDVKFMDSKPPNMSLLNVLLPLIQSRSANRTSVTSLTQGRQQGNDPRAPAAKTAMLLQESNIGLEVMVEDWNDSGWNDMANFVWKSMYEIAVYVKDQSGGEIESAFNGLIVEGDEVPKESTNKITLTDLERNITWVSQASASMLNPQIRADRFLKLLQIFMPMLDKLAQFNPELFKVYFLRWMNKAAQEVELSGITQLIPTTEEMRDMPAEGLMDSLKQLSSGIRDGRGGGQVEIAPQQLPEGGNQ